MSQPKHESNMSNEHHHTMKWKSNTKSPKYRIKIFLAISLLPTIYSRSDAVITWSSQRFNHIKLLTVLKRHYCQWERTLIKVGVLFLVIGWRIWRVFSSFHEIETRENVDSLCCRCSVFSVHVLDCYYYGGWFHLMYEATQRPHPLSKKAFTMAINIYDA